MRRLLLLLSTAAYAVVSLNVTILKDSGGACTTSLDCSLNGACTSGKCACNKAWQGAHCDQLALLDRPDPALGYHGEDGPGGGRYSSWGAAPLRGADGKYHAILSEMGGGVGLKLWTCASRIVHATSTDPLTEPFKRERVLFDSFAHEPRCASVPDAASAFVCFFAYNPLGGPQLGKGCGGGNGSTPTTCDCSTSFRFRAPTAMSYTTDIDSGVWSEPRIIEAVPPAPDSNMSPYVYRNGSLLALVRSNSGSNIHLVTATDWRDETSYTYHAEDIGAPFFLPEDPFLYRDASGSFHSLHHAYPKPYGPHAFSPDGLSWYTFWSGANITQHEAYMDRIEFDDGSVVRAGCRERPSLVFAEDGTTPIALMNGLSPDPSHVGDQPSGSCRFSETDYAFTSLQLVRSS